jgi:hypothetical protein
MKDFIVTLRISAENKSDAEELINDFTGEETDVEIIKMKPVRGSGREAIERTVKKYLKVA